MAIDSRYKLKTGEEVAYFPPIQNTDNPYATEAAMHADQANQLEGYGYLVDGVGAFTYLGTVAGTAADYERFGGNATSRFGIAGEDDNATENRLFLFGANNFRIRGGNADGSPVTSSFFMRDFSISHLVYPIADDPTAFSEVGIGNTFNNVILACQKGEGVNTVLRITETSASIDRNYTARREIATSVNGIFADETGDIQLPLGVSGTFTTVDSKTVTVTDGIITSIV